VSCGVRHLRPRRPMPQGHLVNRVPQRTAESTCLMGNLNGSRRAASCPVRMRGGPSAIRNPITWRPTRPRIPPPQPASQSLTHTESGRARNASIINVGVSRKVLGSGHRIMHVLGRHHANRRHPAALEAKVPSAYIRRMYRRLTSIMRIPSYLMVSWALLLLVCGPTLAQTVAVFDFELIDTSLEGEINGARADEQARLSHLSDQLRQRLRESGRFSLVNIKPIESEARASNLQACGGCDTQLAKRIGAELAITGTVQKVSNLILNMNIYVRTGRADLRHPALRLVSP
jgi:hypothetical protein